MVTSSKSKKASSTPCASSTSSIISASAARLNCTVFSAPSKIASALRGAEGSTPSKTSAVPSIIKNGPGSAITINPLTPIRVPSAVVIVNPAPKATASLASVHLLVGCAPSIGPRLYQS